MPYVSPDFDRHPNAPEKQWVCTRISPNGPFSEPPSKMAGAPGFCGQCVSYVTQVCPDLPVNTRKWVKGKPVEGNKDIERGTAIATFKADGQYEGHAAIFVKTLDKGFEVWDQWISDPNPKPIGPRTIRWDGVGVNGGKNYYVVEPAA